ncbi:MGDG synthase family glycosyltransferase [Peptostreptococcus equinus]|uniref:Glycosyltransferase n=1 Tax=Peptostreptococcus equinus TaxID=3003601 RepID=A0ABY7JM73_9FIRM|nr:glycosyltransferase [Peptostreptococcus sp. CBA3647]WAW14455.1 glycosyltransferase [Peptostreptococcus sp. CBA3647]
MKVVVLAAKFGMGHMAAADSISEDILKLNKDAQVEVLDFYDYSMPVLSKCMYEFFRLLLKNASGIYSKFYLKSDNDYDRRDLIVRKLASSFYELIEDKKPDFIVSTFPIISQAFGLYKEQTNCNIPLITCITDVSSHYEWINKNTNVYMVACDEVKKDLINRGVSSEKIVVYGIPVLSKFKDTYKLRNKHIVNNESKLIDLIKYKNNKELLIMGGGLGMLPMDEAFYDRLNSVKGLHTTIVTGNNKAIFNFLNGKYENITVYGFRNDIDVLMKHSDCVLTKPGGVTLFESIYSQTPLIAFASDLPNEQKNIEFITNNNLGLVLKSDPVSSIEQILAFVNDSKRLKSVKNSMADIVETIDMQYFSTYRGKSLIK